MNAFFTLMGTIFGTTKAKTTAIRVMDKLSFTDEEKSEHRIEQLKFYVPFALAQRVLAFGMLFLYSIYVLTFLIFTIFDGDTQKLIDFADATQIQNIFFAVMLFYFNSGYIREKLDGLINKDKQQ